MGIARLKAPSSRPITSTSTAVSRTPASASTEASVGPDHSAQPTPPRAHCPPLALRPVSVSQKLRQFPAHSRYATTDSDGSVPRSASVSSISRSTASPVTRRTYCDPSRRGVGAWFRTKNSSFGVMTPSRSSRRVSRFVGCWKNGAGSFTHGSSTDTVAASGAGTRSQAASTAPTPPDVNSFSSWRREIPPSSARWISAANSLSLIGTSNPWVTERSRSSEQDVATRVRPLRGARRRSTRRSDPSGSCARGPVSGGVS